MEKKANKYEKLIKVLQVVSIVFMLVMIVVFFIFKSKYNIKINNLDAFVQYFTGGTLTVAAIIVGITVFKSFTLVFPPAVLFVLSGLVFDNYWVAVLVNFIATALSLIMPYFLGRFAGKDIVDVLKKKYKAINKIDAFAGANNFSVVFVIKAGGLGPSDLTSLVFGAMGISFGKYYLAANLGMLILNVLWTLLGSYGDITNPFSFLIALPALLLGIAASVVMAKRQKKKEKLENK